MGGLEKTNYLLRIERGTLTSTLTVLKRTPTGYISSETLTSEEGRDITYFLEIIRDIIEGRPVISLFSGRESFWAVEDSLGEALFELSNILATSIFDRRLEIYETVRLFTNLRAKDFKALNREVKKLKLTSVLKEEGRNGIS